MLDPRDVITALSGLVKDQAITERAMQKIESTLREEDTKQIDATIALRRIGDILETHRHYVPVPAAVPVPAPPTPSIELSFAERELVRYGGRLQAIQSIRERTGCTLDEAKALVEAYRTAPNYRDHGIFSDLVSLRTLAEDQRARLDVLEQDKADLIETIDKIRGVLGTAPTR